MRSADLAIIRDDASRIVRSLAGTHGFNDPMHRGELQQVFDGKGRSLRYLRPRGVSLDAFGEILFDERVTHRRLTPDEVHQVLQLAFGPEGKTPPKRKVSPITLSVAERRARTNRNRKYVCPTCGQIIRGTRNTLVDCGLCRDMYGLTVRMVRVDPLPEEILASGGEM